MDSELFSASNGPKHVCTIYSVCADLRSPLVLVAPPTDLSICWIPKSLKNDKIHKMHAPKIQGRVFSEVAEAPQAATTQTHRAGRP